MEMPAFDREFIAQALRRLQAVAEGTDTFSGDERLQLRQFAEARLGDAQLNENDRRTCAYIQQVLDGSPHDIATRRNLLLRTTIEKFNHPGFDHVNATDVAILRQTLERMGASTPGAPGQERLVEIITGALERYAQHCTRVESAGSGIHITAKEHQAEQNDALPAGAHIATHPPRRGTEHDAQAFFGPSIRRETVGELEGMAFDRNVRCFEHEGDLTIRGDIPDDVLLYVRAGGLTVRGFLSGCVVVDDSVQIEGNVQGGWAYSRRGAIQVGRILAASRVICPLGQINCAAIERAGFVYCGGLLSVAQDAQGGHLAAQHVDVGGALRSARVSFLETIRAKHISGPGKEHCELCFRQYLTPEDFGRPLEEALLAGLRAEMRATFRVRVSRTACYNLKRVRRSVLRAMIYQLSVTEAKNPAPAELIDTETVCAYLSLAMTATEAFMGMLESAAVLGSDALRGAAHAGLDELTAAEKQVNREIANIPDDLGKLTKEIAPIAWGHLIVIARKLKDGMNASQPIGGHYEHLKKRMEEYFSQVQDHARQLACFLLLIEPGLGPAVVHGAPPGELRSRMLGDLAEAQAKGATQAGAKVLRLLQRSEERARANEETWEKLCQEAQAEQARIRGGLEESGAMRFLWHAAQDRSVRAEGFGQGVHFYFGSSRPLQKGEPLGERISINYEISRSAVFTLRHGSLLQL
ncbi:MAG: hypothetical protein HYV27_25475 [Candidatus Hydrogenedentes bacterium]|nr:hypothetical protein [Candidatus Hydrogenedentota bacterium]